MSTAALRERLLAHAAACEAAAARLLDPTDARVGPPTLDRDASISAAEELLVCPLALSQVRARAR